MPDAQPDAAVLPDDRRLALESLLEQRAAMLQPSSDTINRALRRCVRHHLRVQKKKKEQSDRHRSVATEAGHAGKSATANGTVKISSGVAKAVTESDQQSQQISGKRSSQAWLAPGRVIGGYRIEKLIGAGGMGQVYRATQMSMNREVALKVLAPRLSTNPRFRDRFLREARAAGRLHHANLIAVHDVGEAEGMMFFSMELVEGRSVMNLIAELKRIPEDRALTICSQTLEALGYAHERGLIHRDIKPDNLMLMENGTVKVADLGLSRFENVEVGGDSDNYITQEGTMMGTPYYMPPEQGRDAHKADIRSDIYAVGSTMYHMVCGKVPFDGDNAVAILINSSAQPLQFPEPGPTKPLRDLLLYMMAKDPNERPQTAFDCLELIAGIRAGNKTVVEGMASHAERATIATVPAAAALHGRRWLWVSVGMLAAVLLATLISALTAGNRQLQRLRDEVAACEEADRYDSALGLVDVWRRQLPKDSPQIAQAEQLSAGIQQRWDDWAMAKSRSVFEKFDADVQRKQYRQATARLDEINESWRSPAVLAEINKRDQQLFDARDRPGDFAAIRPHLDKMVARWWAASVGQHAKVGPESTIFGGSGRCVLRPLPFERTRMPAVFVFGVRMRGDDGDFWQMALGPDRSLKVSGGALSLIEGSATTRLADAGSDGVQFSLSRVRSDVYLKVNGTTRVFPDGVLSQNAGPELSWKLAREQTAEVRLNVDFGRPDRENARNE